MTDILDQLQRRIDDSPPELVQRLIFLGAYRRTTAAVAAALNDAGFEDPVWVQRWDTALTDRILAVHDADLAARPGAVSRPWRLALDAPADLRPLRQVLLGVNALVNYDLPQALLATISDDDFADPAVIALRRRDLERIDAVLAARVVAENNELGPHPLIDRTLMTVNRFGVERLLREVSHKVWSNVEELQYARLLGVDAYRIRLAELEVLTAARVNDLLTPGRVLHRLTASGFAVLLPPAGPGLDRAPNPGNAVSTTGLPRQRTVTARQQRGPSTM